MNNKRWISGLLIILLILSLFAGSVTAASENVDERNSYVTNISYGFGFEYSPELFQYTLTIPFALNFFQPTLTICDPMPTGLACSILYDNQPINEIYRITGYFEFTKAGDNYPLGLSGVQLNGQKKDAAYNAPNEALFPIGEKHTLSLVIGIGNGTSIVDENPQKFDFIISRSPGPNPNGQRDGFYVYTEEKPAKNWWKKNKLEPKYDTGTDADTYYVITADMQYIWIDLPIDSASNIVYYIGNKRYSQSLSGEKFDLSDSEIYDVKSDTLVHIPIRFVYSEGEPGELSKNYSLLISSLDYRPQIITQPSNITVAKGDISTLACEAIVPDNAELKYQWYGNSQLIDGANESIYTVPASTIAQKCSYYCIVSTTIEGVTYSTKSDTATVTTELSYITEPVILKQLCSYILTKTSVIENGYKTQYNAGQHPDSMNIRVQLIDDGVEYKVDIYHNTENKYDGAELVETTVGQQKIQTGELRYQDFSRNIVTRYDTGEHYFYAVVTASDPQGILEEKIVKSDIVKLTFTPLTLDLAGEGTVDEPYYIQSYEDFVKIQELVNNGNRLYGTFFKMVEDITLPSDWEGIGFKPNGADSGEVRPFGGILDGDNHTVTIEKNGKPLFQYTSDAEVRNLNIYGEQISGAGLLDNAFVDYGDDNNYWTGCPNSITVENVTLLTGSATLKSGLVQGGGSGANSVILRNCVIEQGCVIGYDKTQSSIGSFVGNLNGQLDNCVSYATVYGTSSVGGLAGSKGQAMGLCLMRNCAFLGAVEATGDWVGGLFGKGYTSESAPNTQSFNFINCYVSATISGSDYIGGLYGGEGGLRSSMNETDLRDSFFFGTIRAAENAQNVGGIIGYLYSVNETQELENNYFYDASGTATSEIGNSDVRFTNEAATQERKDAMENSPQSVDAFADGTVLAFLNSGLYKNWIQGEQHPVLDNKAVPIRLTISGEYQTEYYIGDEFNWTGMVITVTYSDGALKTVDESELTVSGFDNTKQNEGTVEVSFGPVSASFKVTVLKKDAEGITVYFTLLGDDKHNSDEDGDVHTLAADNLQTWINKTAYTLGGNATVLDLIRKALGENSITFEETDASGTTYIPNVTRNGVKLGEFTNGINSGWLYTINGKDSDLSVSQQFLADGDEIVFHYSDDYTKEDYAMGWTGTIVNDAAAVGATTAIDAANGTVSVTCARACAVLAKKSDGSYILLAATVSGNTATYTVTGYSEILIRVKGDLTGDGKLDSSDTLMLKKLAAKLIEPDGITALLMDLTGDGTVNSSDILKSKRLAVGLDTMAW